MSCFSLIPAGVSFTSRSYLLLYLPGHATSLFTWASPRRDSLRLPLLTSHFKALPCSCCYELPISVLHSPFWHLMLDFVFLGLTVSVLLWSLLWPLFFFLMRWNLHNMIDPGHELNVRAQGRALSPLLPLLGRQENIQSHRKTGREKGQKYKTARKQLTRGQE